VCVYVSVCLCVFQYKYMQFCAPFCFCFSFRYMQLCVLCACACACICTVCMSFLFEIIFRLSYGCDNDQPKTVLGDGEDRHRHGSSKLSTSSIVPILVVSSSSLKKGNESIYGRDPSELMLL
jgi:hypothetical protein